MNRGGLTWRQAAPHGYSRARLLALLATTMLGGMLAVERTAQAQTTPDAPVTVLEPLDVTARKIKESQQDAPLSVTAVGAKNLQDRRIDDVETLLREVPNVGFSSLGDGRSTFLSIRGIGPMSQPLGYDDTSVVTYVDGVPQPLFGSDLRIFDAERVEVLRGPQGTVFGRNAQGGAINIITRPPGDRFEASARGEVGTDWYRLGQLSVSGPLIDGKLAGRLTASYSGVNGDVTNTAPGFGKIGDTENGAFRGSLVATPGADTKLTLSFFGQRDRNHPSNFLLRKQADFPAVALDPRGYIHRDVAGVSLTATHDFGNVVLTSVTAFNHYDYKSLSNNSEALTFSCVFGLPVGFFLPGTDFSTYDERFNSVYQEGRLNSAADSRVTWVAGATFYHDNFKLDSYYQSPFFISTNGWRNHRYRTNSYAVFGEATVPVPGVEGLKVSAGLRYTHDDKHFDARYTSNGFAGTVPSFRQKGSLGFDLVTGRVAVSYDISAQSMVYASVSRGAKSGGFPNFTNNAPTGLADQPYKKSTSWTYELGTKNRLLGGRAFVNAALFLNNVKDQNLFALDSASFTFVPKPLDTRSYGAEIELGYRLMPGLDLFGSAGYTHATVRNVSADVAASSGAKNGNRVPSTPRFTTSLSLQYRGVATWLGLPDSINVFGLAQHQFIGARAADVGSHFRLSAYHIVNAKVGLEFDRFSVYVFGQNLADDRPQYIGLFYGPGAEAVTVGHGRVVGVGAQVRF